MPDSPVVQRLMAMMSDIPVEKGSDLLALSDSSDLNDVELGRLNWSPGKNWVENEGGLPKYIEDIAIGVMKSTGYPREKAIPIAIARVKEWATGKGVSAKTQAKAIAALAAWEALKAKAAARRAAK